MGTQKGFTLIELMIVVAIIGILASVALPAYQEYIARAQLSEAIELAMTGKIPLDEFYINNGRWPNGAGSVMETLSGKYTSVVAITSGQGTASLNLTLTATMKNTDVASPIRGGSIIIFTTSGGLRWTCQNQTLSSSKYLPGACR